MAAAGHVVPCRSPADGTPAGRNPGGGDAEQPGAQQPAGEPVLEDLARRQEEEAGTAPTPWQLHTCLFIRLPLRLLCFWEEDEEDALPIYHP